MVYWPSMRAKGQQVYCICVATSPRLKASRDRFAGIMRYASTHTRWIVRFLDPHRGEQGHFMLSNELADGERVDAAIGHWMTIENFLGERAHRIPIVDIHSSFSTSDAPPFDIKISVDNAAIAKTAARLLLGKGLMHLGFVSYIPSAASNETYHQEERQIAFRETAKAANATFHEFISTPGAEPGDLSELVAWLKALPLPCGILAHNDRRAQTVIDACHIAQLKIPDQIQVVGVDNEEEICENTSPALTSILPDFEGCGYVAAQMLDYILRHGRPRRKLFRKYGVKAVVERASTQDMRGGGRIVTQACEYMRLNAGKKINVDNVATHLKISRRTLEMRFGEILGKGVADVLRTERLARVCRLLKETNRTISDISFDSGFASPTHLKALFKKTHGMTMAAWRETR